MRRKGFYVIPIAYVTKAKVATPKEKWLVWRFGRKIEPLEDADFSRN